ncbi:MAG: hypothetical protein IPP51_18345 [Bacteroidetes bacterium]|nr:hypothetical protein [Bacteroidota bacterium]
MKKHVLFSILFAVFAFPAFAQDDLLKMLESNEKKQHLPVIAMFKGHKLINIHTNETVSKHNLDVRITHLLEIWGQRVEAECIIYTVSIRVPISESVFTTASPTNLW